MFRTTKTFLALVAFVFLVAASPSQPRTVPEAKALVALDPPANGTVIYRAGYYAPGDGGAAFYTFSTSACPLKDGAGDGGSQIQPGSGGGCWLLATSSVNNVRIWGAKCDGTTDDTVAINSARSSSLNILLPNGCKTTAGTLPGINYVLNRLYVGGSLTNNIGNTTCGTGDWLEQVVPGTSCISALASLTNSLDAPYATTFASRTSNNPGTYAFASVNVGLNDSATAVLPVETLYDETRAYTSSSHTLAEESDIINAAISNTIVKTVSPYAIIGGTPIIVNKWLSNGRPDYFGIFLAGSPTTGDVISFTVSGSVSPQTISTTVVNGDTLASITTRLTAAFNANSVLHGAGMIASQPGKVPLSQLSVTGAQSTTTVPSTSVSGAGTEQISAGFGANASAGIVAVNNSSRLFGSVTGAYKSGIVFDCLSLQGADCGNSSGTFGEALALGRNQAIDFYTSTDVALSPRGRIFSSMTPAGPSSSVGFSDAGIVVSTPNLWSTGGLIVQAMPTSCSGQVTGTLWNSSGTVKICP